MNVLSTQYAAPQTAHAIAPAPAFVALGVHAVLARALAQEGYVTPTPIQTQSIPHVLEGRDLLASAQTGTGKTAAFLLPILQQLAAKPSTGRVRALVLTPTRELAAQITERASAYGRHARIRNAVIYGGVGQRRQEEAIRRGVDLLVATPGRLLDLLHQRVLHLDAVEHFVLDEADRMLDMGFVHDVRRVVSALPRERQTLFFSATMPPAIADLARTILRDPVRVAVAPAVTSAETVEQSVYFVAREGKRALLERVLREADVARAIVFTRTKRGADRVAQQLDRAGIQAMAIHGDKSQGARERALEAFRRGDAPVLVATDLAARGIDVDGISHVVNYELPDVAESYVHRIGRTGRAGASGTAISFCDGEERDNLASIERLLRRRLPVRGGSIAEATAPRDPAQAPIGAARPQHPQQASAQAARDGGGGAPRTGGGRRPRRYRGARLG